MLTCAAITALKVQTSRASPLTCSRRRSVRWRCLSIKNESKANECSSEDAVHMLCKPNFIADMTDVVEWGGQCCLSECNYGVANEVAVSDNELPALGGLIAAKDASKPLRMSFNFFVFSG